MSEHTPGVSRRALLRGGAVTAATAAITATSSGCPAHAAVASRPASPRTFSRMFPQLPAFARPSTALHEALVDLARPGGVLDARDDLTAGPVLLITDPSRSLVNRDNPTMTAGVTFLGQFLDHDMTLDTTSVLGTPTAVEHLPNQRDPRLDLDSVYGGGPVVSPQLYLPDRLHLRVESGGVFEDVPRLADGTPVMGDRRNDTNLVVAGLHVAFLRFHNAVVDALLAAGHRGDVFQEAQRLVRWHYQWVVVHEFLPLVVGAERTAAALRRQRPHSSGGTAMPVEFSGAAYRFGHSMVRPSYRANLAGDRGGPFFGFIFDPASPPEGYGYGADPDDLSGGYRAPRRFVGWQTFFDFGDGAVRRNKRIDATLSTPLFALPLSAIATGDRPLVLPQRTLLRHVTYGLPSGQDVARQLGVPPLAAADVAELAGYGLGLETHTPLWYYVLKEALLTEDGTRLGAVGGTVVAEVFARLLHADATSYVTAAPRWRPTLPQRSGQVTGEFTMVDLLTVAGVDPTSRGQ